MIFQSAKFYGAANLVLDCNIKNIHLSASWGHGVDEVFHSWHSANTYIHPLEFKLPRHLVANDEIKKYHGMEEYEVHAVGAPFVYTNPTPKEHHGTKFQRAYMPSHSVRGISLENHYKLWLKTAIENKCDSIILANSDFKKFQSIMNLEIPSNIAIIRGAKVDEPSTLIRLKNLFYSIKECVFDSPGSHIVYAILCGVKPIFVKCKISHFEYNLYIDKVTNSYPANIKSDMKKNLYSRIDGHDLYRIWSKYTSSELKELCEFSAGMHCKKSNDHIASLLLPKTKKENVKNFLILLNSKLVYKINSKFK